MNPVADRAVDKAMRLIARYLAAGKLQTVAAGLENLPLDGPGILVARHYHHLFDGLAMYAAIGRRFHIVVAMDWARDRRTRFFVESLNRMARWPMVLRDGAIGDDFGNHSIFTPSDARRYQLRALKQSVELLAEGRLVVIFPEGYPNIDPRYTPKTAPDQFLPFKSGFATVAKIAERVLNMRIPIVPVGLSYKSGDRWIAQINFGAPLFCGDFTGRETLVQSIEREVKRLSGVAAQA